MNTRNQLERITDQELERTLRICKEYLIGSMPEGPFRLFHKSFADFLLDDKENTDYHIDAIPLHKRIVNYYKDNKDSWKDVDWKYVDDYGLRYLSIHAYELRDVKGFNHQLYDLICEPAKLWKFDSPKFFLEDIALAIQAAHDDRPPNFVQEIRGILIDEALKAFAKHTPANILWSLTRIGKYQQALGYAELTEGKSKIEAHVLIAEALVQIGEADIANGIFKQVLREIFENNDITGNTHYFGRVITDLYKTYDEEPGYLLKVAKSVKDPRYKTKILNNIAYTLPNQGNWIKRLG